MAGKTYHHGDLRRALVDAALTSLRTRGSAEITLRSIARDAGVTHTSAYHHFRNKEDLFAEVAEEGYRELAQRMARASGRAGGRFVEQLDSLARAYVRFAADRPAHFRVMAELPMRVAGVEREGLRAAHDQAFGLLLEVVERGQETGEVAEGEASAIALALWTLVNGFAESHRTGRGIFIGRPNVRLTKRLLDESLTPLLERMFYGVTRA